MHSSLGNKSETPSQNKKQNKITAYSLANVVVSITNFRNTKIKGDACIGKKRTSAFKQLLMDMGMVLTEVSCFGTGKV